MNGWRGDESPGRSIRGSTHRGVGSLCRNALRFERCEHIGAVCVDRFLSAGISSTIILRSAAIVAGQTAIGARVIVMLRTVALVARVMGHARRIRLRGRMQAARRIAKRHGTGRHGYVHPRNRRQQQRATRCCNSSSGQTGELQHTTFLAANALERKVLAQVFGPI